MNIADDDFALFGLARRQALEPERVDERWRELQAAVHPDRFAAEGASAQRVALQWATRINQARQRLKDPLSRAAYLCELWGVPVEAERNTAMPAAFLMQQMQWREALEEAQTLGAIRALDDEVTAARRTALRRLDTLLGEDADESRARAAASEVRALMFMRRFQDDVSRRLEALEG